VFALGALGTTRCSCSATNTLVGGVLALALVLALLLRGRVATG
jgi:hypothetical protein